MTMLTAPDAARSRPAEYHEPGVAWRQDPAWCAGFLSEVLRLSTPWPVTTRIAAAPVSSGGTTVRSGGQVQLWWPAANRNPQRPGAAGHLAFGGPGMCACTGRHLALAAMDTAPGGLLPVLHDGTRLARAERSTGLVDGWSSAVFGCNPALAAPFPDRHAMPRPG
jgi:cytochrome P450